MNCGRICMEKWHNIFKKKNLPEIYCEALRNRIALGVLGLTLNVTCARMSFWKKWKELRKILKSEKYQRVLRTLDTSRMPKKWKLFYGCAQHGNALALLFAGKGYYILTVCH